MTVRFEGREVELEQADFLNLTLAYCMSIHKSQGSEFSIVILPMVRQYSRMYARNLLYTALTRAKLKLMLIGEPSAYANCIRAEALNRETMLKQQIVFQFTGKKLKRILRKSRFILKPKMILLMSSLVVAVFKRRF